MHKTEALGAVAQAICAKMLGPRGLSIAQDFVTRVSLRRPSSSRPAGDHELYKKEVAAAYAAEVRSEPGDWELYIAVIGHGGCDDEFWVSQRRALLDAGWEGEAANAIIEACRSAMPTLPEWYRRKL